MTMQDLYAQLAAALWFLSEDQLAQIVSMAEQLALNEFRASLDEWTVF